MATPISVRESRTIPVPLERAFRVTLTTPLPEIFSRRHLMLPAIMDVRGQTGAWGDGGLGQTRTIVLADRGTLLEELTMLEPDDRFGYTLSRITGAMRPLVSHIEGVWTVAAAGEGRATVTWAWTIHPRAGVASPMVRLIARAWHGYAAKALERIEQLEPGRP